MRHLDSRRRSCPPVLSRSAETSHSSGRGTRSPTRHWSSRPTPPGGIDQRAVRPIAWHGRQLEVANLRTVANAPDTAASRAESAGRMWRSMLGLPRQGRVCGRVGRNHDHGHASHADHGDWLTHRRWPWTRWRQARNRPGTPGAYLVDGLVPARDPALPPAGPRHLRCQIAARPAVPRRTGNLAVTPHQIRFAPVPPALSGMTGPRRRAGPPGTRRAGLPARRHRRARRKGGSCCGHVAIPASSARWPQCRGLPWRAMTGGPSGEDQDAELEWLRREYPRWRIWRGRATGDYWALPPPGHPAVRELISASDIGELARRLAQAEGRHGL